MAIWGNFQGITEVTGGGRGVKKLENLDDIIYGWSLRQVTGKFQGSDKKVVKTLQESHGKRQKNCMEVIEHNIQIKSDQTEWLLNKPYVSEFHLKGQNLI